MNKYLNIICLALFFLISVSCIAENHKKKVDTINSFDECVSAGNKVFRSYPAKCATKDGKIFIDEKVFNQERIQGQVGVEKVICKNLCGDGICQEIVCMAEGCPCSESASSCPADCS